MPIYVYEVITGDDDDEGQVFEVEQRMTDAPLTVHPTTGQPVRRVFQPPNLPSKWTDRQAKSMLSNENLAKKGFTKYEKGDNGTYHKTAGDGPPTIQH